MSKVAGEVTARSFRASTGRTWTACGSTTSSSRTSTPRNLLAYINARDVGQMVQCCLGWLRGGEHRFPRSEVHLRPVFAQRQVAIRWRVGPATARSEVEGPRCTHLPTVPRLVEERAGRSGMSRRYGRRPVG